MADDRSHEFEIVSSSGPTLKVVATFWWDGKKVRCSKDSYMKRAENYAPMNLSPSDGIEFLEALPQVFRTAYLFCRKKKDEV